MAIFHGKSRARKWYFRTSVMAAYAIVGGSIVFMAFDFMFTEASPPEIPYADVIEYYHYYYSAADAKKIAITIDDGPRAGVTSKLMDIMEARNVPATFFFVGQKALALPDIVAETHNRGFSIGNHSLSHQPSIHESRRRLGFEIQTTSHIINKITGTNPIYYRPPFLLGIGVDPTVNPYIALSDDVRWILEYGYIPVGSDIDPHDWLATSKEDVVAGVKKALQTVQSGRILLLHDEIYTAEALGEIIDFMRKDGYSFVTLEEVLIPPTTPPLTQILSLGDTDATTNGEVSALQWFLYTQKLLGPYHITGSFDAETRSAVIQFQIKNKIIGSANLNPMFAGVVGNQTRAAILRAAEKTSFTSTLSANLSNIAGNQDRVGTFFLPFLKNTYLYTVPVFSKIISNLIIITLILVLFRFLTMASLLLYGKIKRKNPTPPTSGTAPQGITVIIPAYNEEENIRSTIESVRRARYANREIIIVDDGSKDKTGAEAQGVIDTYPSEKIRLLTIDNGGKARAINIAMKEACHEIIVVLDADAVLHPDALGYFITHFANPNVAAVAGKVATTASKNFLNICQTIEYAVGQNIEKRAFSVINAVGVVPGPAGAWRKKYVLAAGGFNADTLVEDQDMTLTMLRMGKNVHYDPRAISFTETPNTLKNFLKQRFRWVFGTVQSFWKHKKAFIENPRSALSLAVLPNTLVFNIVLPLTYPITDIAFIFAFLFGQWQGFLLPFLLLTGFDIAYAAWGVWNEKRGKQLLWAVPFQRIVYRVLLFYIILKSMVRAIEGTGSSWNKFTKTGETRRFYLSSIHNDTPHHAPASSALTSLTLCNKTSFLPTPFSKSITSLEIPFRNQNEKTNTSSSL